MTVFLMVKSKWFYIDIYLSILSIDYFNNTPHFDSVTEYLPLLQSNPDYQGMRYRNKRIKK